MKIGDIVSLPKRHGLWVVARRDIGSPPRDFFHCVRTNSDPPESVMIGVGDLTTIATPEFETGMPLRYRTAPAWVAADLGEFVTLNYSVAKVFAEGERYVSDGKADIAKAGLVLENIALFLKQQGVHA